MVINNFTGMGTPVERSSAEPELYKRGPLTGLKGCASTAGTSSPSATPPPHWWSGPQRTPPLPAGSLQLPDESHSVVDPAKYRTKEEAEEALANDPIAMFEERLTEAGILTDDQRRSPNR